MRALLPLVSGVVHPNGKLRLNRAVGCGVVCNAECVSPLVWGPLIWAPEGAMGLAASREDGQDLPEDQSRRTSQNLVR